MNSKKKKIKKTSEDPLTDASYMNILLNGVIRPAYPRSVYI